MGRIRYIVVFISVFGITNAFANTAPFFTSIVEDTVLTEGVYWSVWLSADDNEGDALSFSLAEGAPLTMTINLTSGRITWTPDNDDVGVHQITAVVSDGSLSGYLTFYLYVNNVNDAPYWVNITDDTVTVAEDSDLEITVTANDDDLDHGDHIKYLVIHGPEFMTIDSISGTITGTPNNSNVGFYTITVRAQDDSLAAVDWPFKLEVTNTDVEFSYSPPTEINEDEYYESDLQSTDENQGSTIYYFLSGYQPAWLTLEQYTGALTGTPDNSHVRTDSVIIIVDDSHSGYDTLAYELTVVNAKPTITTGLLPTGAEDQDFYHNIESDDEGLGSTFYRFLDDIEAHPTWLSLIAATGELTGIPDNAFVGTNSFTIEFDDGNTGKDTAQFVINVSNDPPVIYTANLVSDISEDYLYSCDFNSSDDGQGTVTYHGIGLPDWLSVNLSSGILQGTPNNEDLGDFAISIYVFDGTDSNTVSYTIHVENRVPQKESTEVTNATEDSEYTYDIDYDDEGEGATYSWQIQPSWLSLNTSTGLLSGTPDNSNVGDTTVSVKVDDGNGGIVYHTFNINVANIAPVFEAQADTSITQDSLLIIDLYTDDEGDPIVTYEIISAPLDVSLGDNNGIIHWTPDNSQVGDNNFEIRATDNHGGLCTITFTVTVSNLNPVILSTPPTTAEENTSYVYDVRSNEEGIGDVTYSLTTSPDWLSIVESTGYIEGVPRNNDVGTHNVTVRVDDGNSGYATQTWTITVSNLSPTITNEVLDTATEDSSYSYQIIAYPADEGDLIFSLVGDHPDWISINPLGGALSGTPSNSDVTQTVKDSIVIRVEDEHGGFGEKKLELIVNNSLPVFTTTDNITVVEDESLSWDINTNDEGDEGPNASGYNLVTAPEWVSINASTGVLSGTPTDDDVGTEPLSIRYQDGNGGVVNLNINIIIDNYPPVITSLSPITTATEGVNYSFQFTSDEDDWDPTYSASTSLPANLSLSADGLLSGIPLNESVGNYTINIIVTDNNGGQDNIEFTLTISNAAPLITGYTISDPQSTVDDTVYISEDLSYTIDFAADDEADGDGARYTINHKPDWLTTTSTINGTLSGTPDNRYVGLDYVDVTFADGNGGTDVERIYLRVQNVISSFIDPPSSVTATEDVAFSLDLNSSDEGQGTITYSITDGDPGWLTLDSETGEISGTPDNDDVTDGVDVTIQVTDGNGGTATKTIIFIVENVNDEPTWTSAPTSGSTISTAEDALYTVDIDANDVDIGDNITYSLTVKPTGMTINSSTGVITWTPDNSQVGSHSVTVQAVDDNAAAIIRSWTVQVTNVASPIDDPVVGDFSPSDAVSASADTFYIKEDTAYSLNLTAPDEGVGSAEDVLYGFGAFPNPDWVTLSNSVLGIISLSPTNDNVGLDSFKVFFKDQPGSRDTATIYLRVENVAPAILTEGPFEAIENEEFIDTLRSSDDGDGTITWSFVSGEPSWLNIEASTGKIYGTPGNDDVISDASFTVQVNDGNGGLTQKSFDYNVENVNSSPSITAVPTGTITTNEDALYTTDINASDSDAGDVLTYSLQTAPTGMTINSTSGVIQWTPTNSQVGTHTVTVEVMDSAGEFVTSSWQVRVNNLNDAPTWVSVPSGTIDTDEDEEYSVIVDADDIDVGDNIVYSLVTGPGDMTIDAETGQVFWIPDNDDVGLHDITVKVTDDSSANITASWMLSVQNVNDNPAWSSVPTGTMISAEDAVYTVDVDASDVDAGDVIAYSLTQKPTGMIINSSSGVISWTPDNSNVGTHPITVKATDLSGGFTSQSYTLQITNVASTIVTPVVGDFSPSDAVTATADTFYIKEDTSYTLNLSSADESVGASSIYSFDDFPNPDWVSLSNATTGIVSLTPTNGDVGLDSFQVYFKDQPGSRDTIIVYLRVENVAPEILTDGPFTATENAEFSQQLESSDDDDGTITWSFKGGQPGWLNINSSTGILTGTPGNDDVISDDSFTIEVNDGNGGLTEKIFDYSVENVNNDPVWTLVPSGTVDIDEDSLYTVTITATDDDAGDVLTYSLVSPPTGMLINSSSGVITWTPDNSQVGNHSISVKATDLSNADITSNWILSVTNSPSQINPVVIGDFQPAGVVSATVDTFFIWEDSTYTLDLNASDESQGDAPVYRTTNLSNPDWVTLSNTQNGLITLNPINKDVGLDSFRVVFEDQIGSTDTIKIYIKVNNSTPSMIAAGPFSATEDVAFEADLESTDEDVTCSFTFVGEYPVWLSINSSNGVIYGTPTNDDVGTEESFTVQVNDGHGGTDDRIYLITVTNTNDPPTIISSTIITAKEDSLYLYAVNAQDPDNDILVYSLETNPVGMTINSESGLIQWIPDNSNVGVLISVTVKVDDGNGETAIQSWTIDVSNTNPEITTTPTMLFADEDENFSFDINADDEGQGTTEYSIVYAPTWLVLESSSTGQIGGVPLNSNVSTGDILWVKFSDGNDGVDTLKTTLVVRNTSPLFFSQQDTVSLEDSLFALDLRCDDEGYGDITYSTITSLPSWLSLTASNGILNGTPLNEDVETFALSIKVDDGNSGYDTLDFNITVNNAPPTFIGSPISSVYEDSLYSFDLNVDDESSGLVTYSLIINPGWLSVNSLNGLLTGTPLNNHVGDNNVKVMANDGHDGTDTLGFIISVTNTPPIFTTSPATVGQEDILYSVDLDCSDEGQGSMIYTALKKPSWLTLNSSSGLLKGTPLNHYVTAGDSIEIVVNDGKGGFDTLSYVLAISNTAPNITTIFNDTTITEDDVFSYDVASDDEAQGNTKYKFTIAVPSWISLDSLTGVISGTPLNNDVEGQFGLNIQVDDGNGGTDSETFFIAVNNNPPAFTSTITDSIVLENEFFTYDATTDDEGQGSVTYSLIGAPGWLSIDDSSGVLSGTPDNDDVDTSAITIRFSDGNGATIDQHIHIIVENSNDIPFITTTTDKDTLTEDVLWTNTFTASDSDLVYGDHLTFLLSLQPEGMSIDPASGIVSWTPENFQVGDTSFCLIVEDNGALRDSLLFDVHVNNVNDDPWIIAQSDTIAYEDSLFQLAIKGVDIDPGDTIRYEILSAPAGVTINDSSGLLSWTPADSQIGSWDIITRVSDLSVTAADTDTFSVDVRNVNDAPVLVKAVVSDTLYEDSLWTFIFRASDIDSLYDDSLNFELSDHPALMQIDSSSGQVSWTPENADVGSDSFIVWVYDMELASDSIKFRLTIINTNDPPIIVGIPDTTALEDSLFEYIVQYEDVDVGDSVRFELIKTPFAMLIDSVGGKMTWTPGNDDRDSTFEIIYEVRDGIGAAVTDTFDLYVQNVNDASVITELDSIDIFEDSVFKMQFSEWFDKVSDVDNADSTLSWEVISFANLSIQTTVDSLILIGLPDWFGSDTGEVVISDGELNDTTELIVNILPVNDPPVIDAGFPSIISFTEDDTTELDLNLYVSDVDNDLLDLNWSVFPVESEKSKSDKALAKSKRKPFNNQLKSIRLNPFTAALINSEGDSIIIAVDTTTNIAKFYAKPDFFIDGYDFTFVVNDSVGQKGFGSDTVTATIQVNPANDPPVLASLPELYADEDSAITVVLSNWFEFVSDVDNHDTALTWSVVNGSFITAVIIDSLLSVSPLEHWFGDDTLQLIATDDGLLSDTADVIVHFQSVNDPPVFSPIADITVPEDETVYIELNDYVEDVETLDADLTFTVQRISAEGKSLSSTLVPVSIKSSINNDFLFVSETKSLLNEFSSAEEATGEDSIRIAIDALNHIASISGTPNYYTDFQVFTFYVSDGDSVDSINVNIAVASINDKPVLDSLSAITFQEDSLFVLSLSQWDTFVYDVEDSDDTLQWSFEMDDSISLSYDTTDNQITLSGGTNFHGSAVLTVIVADLEGLSDTSSVDITIVPINDPPQIDSSLFEITFDQKDTVDFILDNHVSDVDHSDQSLVWQFIPGDHVYLNYIDASRTVIFWSDQDWFGADTILAVVKDPQNGADSQFVYITVIDTTKPSFELAVFQNQLTSKYVEIDIFPSELLLGNALITTDGDTLAVTRMFDKDSVIYYNATYKIDSTKTVFIYAKGADRAGNIGDFEYQMGVAKISKEIGGTLTDPDSIMTFLFEPNSVQQDICALFLPYEIETQIEPALGKISFMSEEVFPVSNEFDFRIPVTKLENEARIIFSLENMEFLQQYAANLGVYIWQNDEWKYLTTYTSLEKGTYWTYSDKPGIYQIRVDPDNPAIILPEEISVSQNYPNPFNSLTTIEYTIGAGGFRTFDEAFEQLMPYNVSIKVYNILGQEVKTLVKDSQLPGFYTITWDGRNRYGRPIATGLYFYQVIIGEKVFNKKMTILK